MNSLMAVYLAFALASVAGGAPHSALFTIEKYWHDYCLISEFWLGGTDWLLASYLAYLITFEFIPYLAKRVRFYLNVRRRLS
jgi:hypothetical protein